ncbi:hypothetical protein [Thalassoglobus sp.]|uniref:hypothetical protein n=1 Tax=Thalassoglobus sp. TaxID=2795869 RepID=UPI003AA84B4D
MQEHLIELSVGETIHVGEYTVTIVSVEGDGLCFEILDDGQAEIDESFAGSEDILANVY